MRVEDHGYDAARARRRRRRSAGSRSCDRCRCAELAPGRWVVDVGQNINGWVRLRAPRTGRHRDHADLRRVARRTTATSPRSTSPTRLDPTSTRPSPFQTDVVISAGVDGDVFEPRHSTKGFQYVRVEGYDGDLTADDITAVVVHTDLDRRRRLRSAPTSAINALHRIADWSFRGNACDIPTDCPTRERAGWTGDWQIFVETAAFLYDVGGFSVKWLRDLAAEQRPDGKVTNLVPESHPGDDRPPELLAADRGLVRVGRRRRPRARGCSTARPATPQVLADQCDVGAGVGRLRRRRRGDAGATPPGSSARAEPLPHERYLWDSGWHFGEWLEAGETLDDAIAAALDRRPRPGRHRLPPPLGRRSSPRSPASSADDDDADALRRARRERRRRVAHRVPRRGRHHHARHPGHLRPRAHLRPHPRRPARRAPPTASSSSSATPATTSAPASSPRRSCCPVLADTGHLDVAYDLLFQDTEPSWLVMVDRGATTVWEEWGGVDADGSAARVAQPLQQGRGHHASSTSTSPGSSSSNPATAASASRPGPAAASPAPAPTTTRRTAASRSVGARRHRRADRRHRPAGTEAELVLPDGTAETLPPGTHTRRWR